MPDLPDTPWVSLEEVIDWLAGDAGIFDTFQGSFSWILDHVALDPDGLATVGLAYARFKSVVDERDRCGLRLLRDHDAGRIRLRGYQYDFGRDPTERDGGARVDLPNDLTADPHKVVGNMVTPNLDAGSSAFRRKPAKFWHEVQVRRADLEIAGLAPATGVVAEPSEEMICTQIKRLCEEADAKGERPRREEMWKRLKGVHGFANVMWDRFNPLFNRVKPAEWKRRGPARKGRGGIS